jgi:hypothetical protein
MSERLDKMKDKLKYIKTISNPDTVIKICDQLFGKGNYHLLISTRENKKYMIKAYETNNKYLHFGDIDYEDYTYHQDKHRRDLFRNLNKSWSKT